jgi:MFS family permease
MSMNDQLDVRRADSHKGAPIVSDSPPRKRRRLLTILAGTAAGLIIGGVLVALLDSYKYTGDNSDPWVWLVGLPGLLAIAGTVIGWVYAGAPSAEVVDAPVRQRSFEQRGVAATSVDGQEPGSAVPPRYSE